MAEWKNTGNFDGIHVDCYNGRFTGAFDIEEDVAREVACDDVVYVLVAATVTGAALKLQKNDEMRRTNVLAVDGAKILTAAEGVRALKAVGLTSLYGGIEEDPGYLEDEVSDALGQLDLDTV